VSVTPKKVAGHTYLYFQWYQGHKQKAESLGPADSPIAWKKAWDRLKAYHFDKLEDFYSRMPKPVTEKLPLYDDLRQLVEERRRLLEAVKPQLNPQAQSLPIEVSAFRPSRSRPLKFPRKKKKGKNR
jgi:hypothetical protein